MRITKVAVVVTLQNGGNPIASPLDHTQYMDKLTNGGWSPIRVRVGHTKYKGAMLAVCGEHVSITVDLSLWLSERPNSRAKLLDWKTELLYCLDQIVAEVFPGLQYSLTRIVNVEAYSTATRQSTTEAQGTLEDLSRFCVTDDGPVYGDRSSDGSLTCYLPGEIPVTIKRYDVMLRDLLIEFDHIDYCDFREASKYLCVSLDIDLPEDVAEASLDVIENFLRRSLVNSVRTLRAIVPSDLESPIHNQYRMDVGLLAHCRHGERIPSEDIAPNSMKRRRTCRSGLNRTAEPSAVDLKTPQRNIADLVAKLTNPIRVSAYFELCVSDPHNR